jgi:hypothetical protein
MQRIFRELISIFVVVKQKRGALLFASMEAIQFSQLLLFFYFIYFSEKHSFIQIIWRSIY